MATTAEPTTMAKIAYHRPVTIRGRSAAGPEPRRPQDQHRDPGPLGQQLAAGHTRERVGAQVGDRLGDGRSHHHDDDHDGHHHLGQGGDQALEQVADRVGPKDPQGELQGDQNQQPQGQLGDESEGS